MERDNMHHSHLGNSWEFHFLEGNFPISFSTVEKVVIRADKHSITFHWPYCVRNRQHDIDLLTLCPTSDRFTWNYSLILVFQTTLCSNLKLLHLPCSISNYRLLIWNYDATFPTGIWNYSMKQLCCIWNYISEPL